MVVRLIVPPPPKITPKNEIDRIAELRAQAQKLREQIAAARKMGEAKEMAELQKELKQTDTELTKLDPPATAPRPAFTPLLATNTPLATNSLPLLSGKTTPLFFGPQLTTPVVTPVNLKTPTDAPKPDAPKPGADAGTIVKDVQAGKSIDQIAGERGVTRDKVIAEMKAGGLTVNGTEPKSDNGDVRTTEITDPKTGKTVTEYYDFQHGSYYTEVKDAKGKETTTPTRDESGQKITTNYDPKTGVNTTRREDDLGTGKVTETTELPSGVKMVKTTEKNGKTETVVTDAKGKETPLDPKQDPTRKGSEGIQNDVAAGKSIDDIAKKYGISKEQVTAQLAAAGLEVKTTKPTSDNGDVQSVEIIDQKTGKPITGYYHDLQHEGVTVHTTDDKGNAVTTVALSDGSKTKTVVEGNGRTTRTVEKGKDTTTSVTFNGYTLTTKPDGSITLHNDATGRDVKVKPKSAEEALANTLVSIDPKSSDPKEAKKAEVVKTTLDGIFAGEELPGLQKAVKDLQQKTKEATDTYGKGKDPTNPTPENPYGDPPPGKAPSGGDWVPMNGKWYDPKVAKAMDAENTAVARSTEASTMAARAQAQLNVYALDPAYKGALADAKALLDDKLAPFGLEWNAPKPEGTLAAAKKDLTDVDGMLANATKARQSYENAQNLRDQAIAKQPPLPPAPPKPGEVVARPASGGNNTRLTDAQSKAAHDEVTSLFYQAGLQASQGDKALADYLVGLRQQEFNATKSGTPERTAAEKNLNDAKTLSTNAGTQLEAATAYSNYYSATSTVSKLEVKATDIQQRMYAQYAAANPGMVDRNKDYFTYDNDFLGKIQEQSVVEDPKDHQLYLETKYEEGTRRIQLTWPAGDKNMPDKVRDDPLNKEWQSVLTTPVGPTNTNVCTPYGGAGLPGAKGAQTFAAGQIQKVMQNQLTLARTELDKQITDLKTKLDGTIKDHGPGSVEAPEGLLPPGTKPVPVKVNGQDVEVAPDQAADVQKGGIDAILKGGKPVHIQINGQWLWVDPDVAAAQINLGATEDQRAAVENARQSAERSEQWFNFMLSQPLKLLDDAGSASYNAHLQNLYLDEHRDQALAIYQNTFQQLYETDSGFKEDFTRLEKRQDQETLVANTLKLDTSSAEGKAALDKVIDEIHGIGGDAPTIKAVPVFYVDDQVGSQQTALFAVQGGDKTWYVDAAGQKFESIKDFQDNNRQFQESGKLVLPTGLNTKRQADGTIALDVVKARNVSTADKIIDPLVGLGTAVATAVAVIPNPLSPIAAVAAVGGSGYLLKRAVEKEISYLQHGGEVFDMESMMNIGTVATTVLPMGGSLLRTAGLVRTTELSLMQSLRASVGATRQGSSVATAAENYMRSPALLNRMARGLDWAAIGTGVPMTAVSMHDLAAYGDQMSGLELASTLTGLGVGIAGTGLGVRGLRATTPTARTGAGHQPVDPVTLGGTGKQATAFDGTVPQPTSFESGQVVNYLPDGTVTVSGKPVSAKDLKVGLSGKGAADKDTFLVIADEADLPGATKLVNDLADAGYQKGQSIVILACRGGSLDHAGSGPLTRSLAGQVADRLGVRVRAYDGPVEIGGTVKPVQGGREVVETPGLPVLDVSGGGAVKQANHETQTSFWFGGGKDAAPPASPESAYVPGRGTLDPTSLGKKPNSNTTPPAGKPPTIKELQATDPKKIDIAVLTDKLVPKLKPSQVAGFTAKQWEAFNQAGLQKHLTRNQIHAIPGNRIKNLNAGALTEKQVGWLKQDQVAALTGTQLKALHQAGLQDKLTKGQIGAIPENRVKYLDAASLTQKQIEGLSEGQLAAMTGPQWKAFNQAGKQAYLTKTQLRTLPENRFKELDIGGMTPDQVTWMTVKQWETLRDSRLQNQLTQAQIGAIPTNRIKYLDIPSLEPKQVGWLSSKQLEALTQPQIWALSNDQLHALPDSAVGHIVARLKQDQIHALSTSQMAAVSDKQKEGMSTGARELFDELYQVRKLKPDDMADLKPSTIVNFTDRQWKELTQDQLRAIPRKLMKYVDLTKLSNDQLRAFTPEQMGKVRPSQLMGLTNSQLKAFTQAQVDVLSPFQTAMLKGDQRALLDGYTPASRPVRALAKVRAMGAGDLMVTTSATAAFAAIWPHLSPNLQIGLQVGGLGWRGISMSLNAALPSKLTGLDTRFGRFMKTMDALSYLPTQASGLPQSVSFTGAGSAMFEGANTFYFAKAFREARTGRPAMPMTDKYNLLSYTFGSIASSVDSFYPHAAVPNGGTNLSAILPDQLHFISKGLDFIPGAAGTIDNGLFVVGATWLWARGARKGIGPGQWEPKMTGVDRVIFGVTFGGGMLLFAGLAFAGWKDKQDKAKQPNTNGPDKTVPTPTTTPSPTPTNKKEEGKEPKKPVDKPDTMPTQFVVKADDGLNLRGEPSEDSTVVTVIRPGSLVADIGKPKTDSEGRRWIPVRGYGQDGEEHQGWVEASFVDAHPAGSQDDKGRLNPDLERRGYTPVIAQDGDTMGGIARSNLADVRQTVLLNMDHIASPDVIFAGDRIYLPTATG